MFKFFLTIGGIFGLVPWINFEKNQLTDKKMLRAYPAVLAIVFVTLYMLSLNSILENFFDQQVIIIDFWIIFLPIQSTYSKKKFWNKWIHIFETTNRMIRMKLHKSLELDWKIAVLFTVHIIMQTILEIIRTSDSNRHFRGIPYLRTYSKYVKLLVDLLPITFLMIQMKGLKILNKYSEDILRKERTSFISLLNTNRAEIMFCRNLHKHLYDMSICIQEIFGWTLCVSLLQYVLVVCDLSNIVIRLDFKEEFGSSFWVLITLYFIYRTVS